MGKGGEQSPHPTTPCLQAKVCMAAFPSLWPCWATQLGQIAKRVSTAPPVMSCCLLAPGGNRWGEKGLPAPAAPLSWGLHLLPFQSYCPCLGWLASKSGLHSTLLHPSTVSRCLLADRGGWGWEQGPLPWPYPLSKLGSCTAGVVPLVGASSLPRFPLQGAGHGQQGGKPLPHRPPPAVLAGLGRRQVCTGGAFTPRLSHPLWQG